MIFMLSLSHILHSPQHATRSATRVAITGTVLLLIFVFPWSVTRSYSFRAPRISENGPGTTTKGSDPDRPTPGDKIVVMAKMKTENTDWVEENLPEYFQMRPFFASWTNAPQAGSVPYITWTNPTARSTFRRTKVVKLWHI